MARTAVRLDVRPLTGAREDLDPVVDLVGESRFALLGEASHGTHEFYRLRAEITKRLIVEKDFRAVAVEADWPDAYRVNRWVRGDPIESPDTDAADALADFRRFPTWMWRNADVLDFVGWLRTHDESRPPAERAGFYGVDLYSLYASIAAVIAYLEKVDPAEARRARERYACFELREDPAVAAALRDCEDEVVAQLVSLRRRARDYAERDGRIRPDDFFHAAQNARLATNAERYYRALVRGRASSWNLRDEHMTETLEELAAFLGPEARIVVWEHNSHLGDARATEMGDRGELNVGQLVRERHPDAVLVGFTTYAGTVTAASEWDGPAERKRVRPALAGSYERLFHDLGVPRFFLELRGPSWSRASRGRSESSTGPRRSAGATTSRRASPSSSTP